MRLLFGKAGATKELKDLIPYVDVDLKVENLQPDLWAATNDLLRLIGPEIYAQAETKYYTPNDPVLTVEKNLLFAMRYPIAVQAYRLYAPSNDLAHTQNGRKMRSDDNEKSAFEWQIDRDNAAQEKRYYRALDDVLFFLDSLRQFDTPANDEETLEGALRTTWRTSNAFQASKAHFIQTTDDFDPIFPIHSRLILYKLLPAFTLCENEEILPRIGRAKFDALKESIRNNSLPDTDKPLLSAIKRAVGYASLSWAMMRYSINLFPDGVLQHYTSDRATTRGQKPALNIEAEAARVAFRSDADKALLEIERLVAPPIVPNSENHSYPRNTDCSDKFISLI